MSSAAGARDALLIATGEYGDSRLKRLRSPVKDAKELAAVLRDSTIGGFSVESIINEPHYRIAQSIERFFQRRNPGDLLLVHLSCHGIKDNDGLLYFATIDTDPDLPASTSLSAEFLRNQLQRSRAKSIVLLLDCCYSGSFLTGMKGGNEPIDIREELAGHGRVVITATNRTEYAWEGDNIIELEPQPSQFTGFILKGLRTGDADLDGDGKIAVDELYEYVYGQLQSAKMRQSPRKWADLEYQVFIASSKRRPVVKLSYDRADNSSEQKVLKYRTQRGKNEIIRVEMPLIETAFGARKDLTFPTFVRCDACGATGNASREMPVTCTKCWGSGMQGSSNLCEECNGFGTVIQDPCSQCGGEGRVNISRTIKVRIPKGVEHGTHIQLASEGEYGPWGGPPADLFLEIVELEDDRFERRDYDLYTAATVPSSLTKEGGTFDVETLEGKAKVQIQPGKVTTGTLLRLTGKGVPHLNDPGRGDLMIRVTVL